jgi:hypothetical protein
MKSLPFEVTQLFFSSGYPRFRVHFPRVDGWNFNVGDRIEVGGLAARRATIREIGERDLPIVEFDDGTGLHSLQNWDIRKLFELGDCVKDVVHGVEGFLTKLNGFAATIVTLHSNAAGYDVSLLYINLQPYKFQQEYTGHVNFLEKDDTQKWNNVLELVKQSHDRDKEIRGSGLEMAKQRQEMVDTGSGQIPWLHRPILIVGGPHRSKFAIVFDVQNSQQTQSSLRIVARIETQGPSLGNQVLLDYDHVVDQQCVQSAN